MGPAHSGVLDRRARRNRFRPPEDRTCAPRAVSQALLLRSTFLPRASSGGRAAVRWRVAGAARSLGVPPCVRARELLPRIAGRPAIEDARDGISFATRRAAG